MKVLITVSPYKYHANKIYREKPELVHLDVVSQTEYLKNRLASSFEFWSREFINYGWDSNLVFPGIEQFQKAWLKEFRPGFIPNKNLKEESLLEQIIFYKPTLLFILDLDLITPSFISKVRDTSKHTQLIATWYGAPIPNEKNLKCCDLVFTNSKDLRWKLKNIGVNAHFIFHAFESSILNNLNNNQESRKLDFAFIGTINRDKFTHLERSKTIELLAQETNLKIWSELDIPKLYDKVRLLYIAKRFDLCQFFQNLHLFRWLLFVPPFKRWSDLSVRPNLNEYFSNILYQRLNTPVFGDEMLMLLNQCKLVFNGHSTHTGVNSVNMRLFEASGMGTCQLVDARSIISEYFEPGKEIVTYSSRSEALSKSKELINNPSLCAKIGKSAQAKTLKNFTTQHQVCKIIKVLDKY